LPPSIPEDEAVHAECPHAPDPEVALELDLQMDRVGRVASTRIPLELQVPGVAPAQVQQPGLSVVPELALLSAL